MNNNDEVAEMALFDEDVDPALPVILADDDDDLEDGEHRRLFSTTQSSLVINFVARSHLFLISGEHREEVIAVVINGFWVMSNTSFGEHFSMERIVFQVIILHFKCLWLE